MATTTDEKSPTSAIAQPTNEAQQTNELQQDATVEATKQTAPTSAFVNLEPIREDQVQNAVKFLSHPRVRGSPVIHRRSFLERKGLTKEEIDEAFRRVPDPPPSAQASGFNQDGQNTPSNIQKQGQAQNLQPVAAVPAALAQPPGILSKSRFHWYHAVIAVGVLAASGAGTAVLIKNSVIPRLKSWVRKVAVEDDTDPSKKASAKPSLAEEAAAAAKAAAAAAADVARASQEMLNTRNEEKRYFETFTHLLDVQLQEMKSMSNSIRKLEGQTNNPGRTFLTDPDDYGVSIASSKKPYVNGKADYDSRSVRSSSPPTSVEPSMPPHPKSYMEIMAMVNRGEKPSNIREINDLPPNPNQQMSNPRIAPRSKPWESAQLQDNGVSYQLNPESSAPWWQRDNPRITEIENEDQLKSAPFGSSSQSQTSERPPVQRSWVPPQPPPVAMPEAAEAIRRPKPPVKIDQQEGDNESASSTSAGVTDELQKVTKMSELGGATEINGEGSAMQNNTEIQEEQEQYSQEVSA